jgi:integrase
MKDIRGRGENPVAAKSRLLPEFGEDTPLERITDERVNEYRSRVFTEGVVSRRTAQKMLGFMHAIYKRTRFLKWVRINPVEGVEPVRLRPQTEFNYLEVPQVELIARKAPGMYSAAILVAAYTGLRAGDLRAMRWRDVDFANANLRVQRNMPTGGEEEDTPKSGKGRSVPLMDDAARALDALSRREHFTGLDDRVFASETGEVLGEHKFRRTLYVAMDAAGIDRKSFPSSGGIRVSRPAAYVRDARSPGVPAGRCSGVYGALRYQDHDAVCPSGSEARCGSAIHSRDRTSEERVPSRVPNCR